MSNSNVICDLTVRLVLPRRCLWCNQHRVIDVGSLSCVDKHIGTFKQISSYLKFFPTRHSPLAQLLRRISLTVATIFTTIIFFLISINIAESADISDNLKFRYSGPTSYLVSDYPKDAVFEIVKKFQEILNPSVGPDLQIQQVVGEFQFGSSLKNSDIDVLIASTSLLANNENPNLWVFDIPFLFPTINEVIKLQDSDIATLFLAEAAPDGFVPLGYLTFGGNRLRAVDRKNPIVPIPTSPTIEIASNSNQSSSSRLVQRVEGITHTR